MALSGRKARDGRVNLSLEKQEARTVLAGADTAVASGDGRLRKGKGEFKWGDTGHGRVMLKENELHLFKRVACVALQIVC